MPTSKKIILSTHSLIKRTYSNMINRCYNKKNISYKDYGGRGIFVCDEWMKDFNSFEKWALANGWDKGLDLDRRNNNKGYSPDNCRFVTRIVNANNRRNSIKINYQGKMRTFSEISELTGLKSATIRSRIRLNIWF